jgi:hypothetical protein
MSTPKPCALRAELTEPCRELRFELRPLCHVPDETAEAVTMEPLIFTVYVAIAVRMLEPHRFAV